ncbi:MAG: hypothetical protein NC350_06465 [Corallococcus sp.]|nr:hypothetical protein [Corallococcus sp.]
MSAKAFFKSTSFKSVVVLIAIAIVCVALLALLNDVLYVSEDVRFNRAMSKIYPEAQFTKVKEGEFKYGYTDKEPYKSNLYGTAYDCGWAGTEKGSRIVAIEAKSDGVGYQNGDITLYVVIKEVQTSEKVVGQIAAWSVKKNTKQTLMANIPSAGTQEGDWYIGTDIADAAALGNNYVGGVTMSSNAINHAINAAAEYARGILEMGSNPQEEARQELMSKLAANGHTGVELEALNSAYYEHLTVEGTALAYAFKKDGIMAFAYTVNGGLAYIAVEVNGLGTANHNVLFADNAPAGLSDIVKTVEINEKGKFGVLSLDDSGENRVYVVKGRAEGKPEWWVHANEYVLQVEVKDGAVVACTIVKSGFVPGDPAEEKTKAMLTAVIGKNYDELTGDFLDKNKISGATSSATNIFETVRYALEVDKTYGGAN